MQPLNATLIQSNIHWHDIDANLRMFAEKIRSLNTQTDLIILPEMFNTGFTMHTDLAEPPEGKTHQWMLEMADSTRSVITGSMIVRDQNKYYNRLLWIEPDGSFATYDKRHLFRMAREDDYYKEGTNKLIRKLNGWNICPFICYDLRFPVWSRNRYINGDMEYDLCIFVANWPAVRSKAWDILIPARAIENLCYSIGLNRVGVDDNEIEYNGHSMVCDPKGETIYFKEIEEDIQTLTLDKGQLTEYRKKFPAYLDADQFTINL